jgi:hypothetical protein
MSQDDAVRIQGVVSQLETTLALLDQQIDHGFDDDTVSDAMRSLREALCVAIREGIAGVLIAHDQASDGRLPIALPMLVGEAMRSG